MIRARDIRKGDHIVWAGHRCTVTEVHGPCREYRQQRVAMRLDLAVPFLPPRKGLHYWTYEEIETWTP